MLCASWRKPLSLDVHNSLRVWGRGLRTVTPKDVAFRKQAIIYRPLKTKKGSHSITQLDLCTFLPFSLFPSFSFSLVLSSRSTLSSFLYVVWHPLLRRRYTVLVPSPSFCNFSHPVTPCPCFITCLGPSVVPLCDCLGLNVISMATFYNFSHPFVTMSVFLHVVWHPLLYQLFWFCNLSVAAIFQHSIISSPLFPIALIPSFIVTILINLFTPCCFDF